MPYVLTVAGCALLLLGGEVLVRGAVAISLRLGISPMLVGMTVVAFCTSSPELLVSVQAATGGHPEIALGNVVGSNIANIGLVLGATAAILPIVTKPARLSRDLMLTLGASAALFVLGLVGGIGRVAGAAGLVVLVAYIVTSYRIELAETPECPHDWHEEETEVFEDAKPTAGVAVLMLVGGIAALVLGARWLVDGASAIAISFGLSESVVALTVVALGTSLPELATSVVAARRGHSAVAVGNVVGSNAFNILLILGITALISPLPISAHMAHVDIPVMLAFTLVGAAPLMITGRIPRWLGASLLTAYLAYVVMLYAV